MPEQFNSIFGINSPKAPLVTCPTCNTMNEPDADFCTVCGQTLAVLAPPAFTPRAPLREDSVIVSSLMKRYNDGYLVAKATTGFGGVIKGLGIILALLIVLVSLGLGSQTRGSRYSGLEVFDMMGVFWMIGVFLAVVVGGVFYLLGVLVSAQGQILKASLDGAVNSSPFLGNEEKAKVMSLL